MSPIVSLEEKEKDYHYQLRVCNIPFQVSEEVLGIAFEQKKKGP